jgi:cytochrome c-type biogenesis protein CcmF
VSSVHAFAQSDIGSYFLVFMGLIVAVCLFFYVLNHSHLRSENRLESLVSRESSFLFNNLILLVSCFTVLWGTIFPLLSEYVQGHKVTVGPPFFNKVNIPIGLFLIFLTAVGPLLAWRRTSVESIKRNFLWPSLISILVGVVLLAAGMRPFSETGKFYSFVCFILSALVLSTVVSEFYRGARVISRQSGISIASGALVLTRRNTRRYGGYIIHFGFAVICIGFAGSAFNQTNEQELGFRDSMTVGQYQLVCQKYTQDDNPNYGTELAIIDVYKNGKFLETLYPERRFYKASQQPQSMVAIRRTIAEDLYLVYAGKNLDNDKPIIKAHLNPLVGWIWTGVFVIVFGTLIALVPSTQAAAFAKKPARMREEQTEPVPVEVAP